MMKRKHVCTLQIIINHHSITNNLRNVELVIFILKNEKFGHFSNLFVNVLIQYDLKTVMQNTRVFPCIFVCLCYYEFNLILKISIVNL